MLKKILYLTSYPVISTNGADLSAFERLVKLKSLGFATRMISLVAAGNYESFRNLILKWNRRFSNPVFEEAKLSFYYESQLIETLFQRSLAEFEQTVIRIIEDYRPDHIFIRMNDQRTWKILQKLNLANYTVFITDNEFPKVLTATPEEHKLISGTEKFYALSGFLQNSFAKEWDKETGLEYQVIPKEKFLIDENTREYITLINPVPVKGVHLFLALAEKSPDKKFLAVAGWNEKLREQFRIISQRFENITYQEPTDDIREVYAKTKILLVPSLWEEAFPRVIIEAMISGIPCLASAVGGNAEALGEGGCIIPVERNNPLKYFDQWAEKIADLDNDDGLYRTYSEKARLEAEKFQAISEKSFSEFVNYLY